MTKKDEKDVCSDCFKTSFLFFLCQLIFRLIIALQFVCVWSGKRIDRKLLAPSILRPAKNNFEAIEMGPGSQITSLRETEIGANVWESLHKILARSVVVRNHKNI